MMTPMNTALLKYQPDHLQPLTSAERDAAQLAPKRPGLITRLKSLVAPFRRQAPALMPAE